MYILKVKDINSSSVVGLQPSPSLDFSLAIDHDWPTPGTFHGKSRQLYTFREQVASSFGIALSGSFLHHVSCCVSCPVASYLALALPAVELALPAILQQQQLITPPRAAYHPRASSCFFSSRLEQFHCSAQQIQRRQHTHSDSRAPFATGRELLCQLDFLPHTIVQNNEGSSLVGCMRCQVLQYFSQFSVLQVVVSGINYVDD